MSGFKKLYCKCRTSSFTQQRKKRKIVCTQFYKAFPWLSGWSWSIGFDFTTVPNGESGQSCLTLQLFPMKTIVTSNLICQNRTINKWKCFIELGEVCKIRISYNYRSLEDVYLLTLRPPSTTIIPYANSLDPDETPSNSASHPDPSCLTLRQHFHQLWATLRHFKYWSRREI